MISTFIVTRQESFYIKPARRAFPEFELRVLAADLIPRKERLSVVASFVTEKDVKYGTDMNALQFTKRDLGNNTEALKQGTSPWVFVFKGLHFERHFKRKHISDTDRDKHLVYEEKYRILFSMIFDQEKIWTWSLPLTINTASNQEDSSLASVMWQCFSTDVFSFPTNVPKQLPWNDIAEMLSLKMKRLTNRHNLTEENLEYLKRKLLGANAEDNCITLRRFCQEPMIKTQQNEEITFWKWFLGIHNLIDRHLLPYWENGLISGFIGKLEATKKLAREKVNHGTFILRFSETIFDNKDGIKEVYGYLTAVLWTEETSGHKRKSISTHENKQNIVCNRVCGHKQLESNSLAFILMHSDDDCKNPLYLYVYPSNKSLQSTFGALDSASGSEVWKDVEGYNKPKPSSLVDIGNRMSEMSLADSTEANDDLLPGKKKQCIDRQVEDTASVHPNDIFSSDPDLHERSGITNSVLQPKLVNENPLHMQTPPTLEIDASQNENTGLPILNTQAVSVPTVMNGVAEDDIPGLVNCLSRYLTQEQVLTLVSWLENNNKVTEDGQQYEALTPTADEHQYEEAVTPQVDEQQYGEVVCTEIVNNPVEDLGQLNVEHYMDNLSSEYMNEQQLETNLFDFEFELPEIQGQNSGTACITLQFDTDS
ncbi:Signal transducer and activator of transcription [Mactra antiquata]